jgi:hypothetical protein
VSRSNLPHKKDANHDEVKEAVTAAGWQWQDTYQYGGVMLDGIVNRNGITVLVEVKQLRGRLTKREGDVFDNWRGEMILAFTGPQAVAQLADIAARYRRVEDDGIPF